MTKIYYVGAKADQPNGETAFSELTGITWRQRDECHDVDPRVATRMLQHPDVFSDKSPDERAAIEQARREQAEREAAARTAAAPTTGMAALLASLPPGTKITTPDGTSIEIPAGNGTAAPVGSLHGASSSTMASRLAAHTGAGENGAPTTPLEAPVDDGGFGNSDQVQETMVGQTDTSGVTLAPGGTVASASAPAPAPAPTSAPAPAPTSAPATATGGTKAKAK